MKKIFWLIAFVVVVAWVFVFAPGAHAQTLYESNNLNFCTRTPSGFDCPPITDYDLHDNPASMQFATPQFLVMYRPFELYSEKQNTLISNVQVTDPVGSTPGTFSFDWQGTDSTGVFRSGSFFGKWKHGRYTSSMNTTYTSITVNNPLADGGILPLCPPQNCNTKCKCDKEKEEISLKEPLIYRCGSDRQSCFHEIVFSHHGRKEF